MTDIIRDGVASNPTPQIGLIPKIALVIMAQQYELGQRKKGDGAWNAGSKNQSALENEELILDRIDHAILHLLSFRERYIARDLHEDPDDDIIKDAGAIMWAGSFLACAAVKMKQKVGSGAWPDDEIETALQVKERLDTLDKETNAEIGQKKIDRLREIKVSEENRIESKDAVNNRDMKNTRKEPIRKFPMERVEC